MPSKPTIAILGQGIAGTLVSMRLRENQVPHVVIDRGHQTASSYAAAGLVNPVTGRRFVLVNNFEDYVARFGIYQRLGKLLHHDYVQPLIIYRDLSSIKDRNQWDMRRATDQYAPYLDAPILAKSRRLPLQDQDQWLGPTQGAFRVDLPGLIFDYRVFLQKEGALLTADVELEQAFRDGRWQVTGQTFHTVIDCRGAASAKTPYWKEKAWRLSKGESIRLNKAMWPREAATKLSGCFLAPIGRGSDVWYGGTSTDHFVDELPTPDHRKRFSSDLTELISEPTLSLLDHRAAVRPTTTDRLPIIGEHPTLPGLYICNGLGTKGALTAPSVSARLWSMLSEADGALG